MNKLLNVRMKLLIWLISTFSILAYASSDLPSVPPKALIEKSDYIGIVQIRQGVLSDLGLRLIAKELVSIKGASRGQIEFTHEFFEDGHRYTDQPGELGATYLVFLSKRDGSLFTLNQHFSVIEVQSVAVERGAYSDYLGLYNLEMQELQAIGDQYWFPTFCRFNSGKLCRTVKANFLAPFNKRL